MFKFLKLAILLSMLLIPPAAFVKLIIYLGWETPPNLYAQISLIIVCYAGWLGLAFSFFESLPNMLAIIGFKMKGQDPPKPIQSDFSFIISKPQDLLSMVLSVANPNIPYVQRLPQIQQDELLRKMRASKHLLIMGRAGLGKTREAIEFIRRLEEEIAEEISVLIPNGTLEIPISIPTHKLHRNVVLFIDDLPAHYIEPYRALDLQDPKLLDDFRQRLLGTINAFENIYGIRFHLVATAKGDPELRNRLKMNDSIWEGITILELPNLSSERKYEFLQIAERVFELKISIDAKLLLAERSDGTFGGLIFPLIKEQNKLSLTIDDVKQYSCTYPNDWEQQVYNVSFLPSKYRRNLLSALSIIREAGMLPFDFLVIELAARLCSDEFLFFYRRKLKRELKSLSNWIVVSDGLLRCEDAYLRNKGTIAGAKEPLLNSIFQLIFNRNYYLLLRSSLYELINTFITSYNDPLTALKINKWMLLVNPDNSRAWDRAAKLHLQLGDYAEAEKACREAIRMTDRPEPWSTLGLVYGRQGNSKMAVEAYLEAVKKDSSRPTFFMQLGMAQSRTGNFTEAIQAGEESIRLDSHYPLNYISLAITFDKAGLIKQAINCCKTAVHLDKDNAMAWWTLGIALSRDRQYKKAIKAGKIATELAPQEKTSWSIMAQIYDRSHNFEDALHAFEKALEIDADSIDNWIGFGISLDRAQQHDKAVKALEEAVRLDPTFLKGWKALAIAAKNAGNVKVAEEALLNALAIAPKDVEAFTSLGIHYTETNNYEKAHAALRRALQLRPNSSKAKYAMKILNNLLKNKVSESDGNSVYPRKNSANYTSSANPSDNTSSPMIGNVTSTNDSHLLTHIELRKLSKTLLRDGKPKDAIEALVKAAELRSINIKKLRDLGIQFNYSGQTDLALIVAQKLTELEPRNSYNWYALATIYRKLGDIDAARENYQRVIQLFPIGQYANRARQKLQELDKASGH